MKIALVHDWLTGMRGGERVLERLCGLFPGASISTLVWKRGATSAAIEAHPIRTSFLQRMPEAERRYRWYLPLFPAAIERFDFRGFDAVISTSHAVARAVRVPRTTFHYAYVFTPMRYIWELEAEYFPPGRFPWPLSWYVRSTCASLRAWERRTAGRPNVVTAISYHVADRIRRHWGRTARVIYPPVELARFAPGDKPRDYYLLAGAMAPYKRGDLAIAACAKLGRRLVVAGTGQQSAQLQQLAAPGIEFREGWVSDAEMATLYAGAKALLYPGEEDFGIIPLEALASVPRRGTRQGRRDRNRRPRRAGEGSRRAREGRRSARAGRRAVRGAERRCARTCDHPVRIAALRGGDTRGTRPAVLGRALRSRVPRGLRSRARRLAAEAGRRRSAARERRAVDGLDALRDGRPAERRGQSGRARRRCGEQAFEPRGPRPFVAREDLAVHPLAHDFGGVPHVVRERVRPTSSISERRDAQPS
jgi:glycosyltransferase involved in cell wall biosynthesis